MAKKAVSDDDPEMLSKATELRKELQRLVKAIAEEDFDDLSVESIDRAAKTLSALRELRCERTAALKIGESLSCPEEFLCPISKELMRDPVIVATGRTYDRPFIQKWLKAGNRTCPQTEQVLSHTTLTPNYLIQKMISQWCMREGIQLPDPVQFPNEEGLTEADRNSFILLLEKVTSQSPPDQMEAAKELRFLTKRMPSFRALFGEFPDAIPQLVSPLSQKSEVNKGLQEDLITTILNISIHDSNKKFVAETSMVIPALIDALRSGTIETRTNAAAALFTLSALDSNKALIGKSGALKPLIDLLEEGHPQAMKDVGSAIFNLCILHENKARAVREGAVRVIFEKIMNRVHIDELLATLAILASSPLAVEEMGDLGAVSCLLNLIRETPCPRNKENSIAILHTICFSDRTKWKEMKDDENVHGTISELAQNGTSRAKRKASGILERLKRAMTRTHTA